MEASNRKAVVAALLANLGIAIAKAVAYLATGASSMLAEAVHSLADTGNQALLLWGGAAAARDPTPEHPFGFGRERYFWSFVVALVLFSVGGLFAIYEGAQKLLHPHPLASLHWAIGVLVVGIGLESISFRIAVQAGRRRKGDASWWMFIRHTKQPELAVVLLEDLGALVGLVIALIGVSLAAALDDPRFDAVGSIAIGTLLIAIATVLAIEMKSLLIGESVDPGALDRIRSATLDGDEVRRVIHLRTQHLGPDQVLIAIKAEFDARYTFQELCSAIDRVERRIRESVPAATHIYLEPDLFRGAGEQLEAEIDPG